MGRGKRNNLQLDSKNVLFSSKGFNLVSKEEAEREAEKFQRAKLENKPPTKVDSYRNGLWKNEAGQLHRDGDLPAVEYANGAKAWYQNSELHRDNDLPAYEGADGSKEWYQHGKLHRDNGLPAVEYASGGKAWYQNGKLHRENGPAIIHPDGTKEWWRLGKFIKKEDPHTAIRYLFSFCHRREPGSQIENTNSILTVFVFNTY